MTESILVHLPLSFVSIKKKLVTGMIYHFSVNLFYIILYYSIEKLKTIFNITRKHGDN